MTAQVLGWMPDGGRIDVAVTERVQIGAARDNDVVIRAAGVSRQHARIVRIGSDYWIEDTGSRNGTFVNGTRITRDRLGHLDVITLARDVDVVFIDPNSGGERVPVGLGDVRLEAIDGPEAGRGFDVSSGALVIGRADNCDVVVSSPAVSRTQTRIVKSDFALTVEDLGSANGTRVNGSLVKAPTPLRDGDEISVGAVQRFRVRLIARLPAVPELEPPVAPEIPQEAGGEWRTRLIWAGELIGARLPDSLRPDSSLAAPPGTPAPAARVPDAPVAGDQKRQSKTVVLPPEAVVPPFRVDAEPEAGPPASAAGRPTMYIPRSGPIQAPEALLDQTMVIGGPQDVGGSLTGVRLSGPTGQATFPIGQSTVGRAPEATLRLDSRQVSRIHAVVTVTPAEVIVEDKDSINGTTVNGARATGARPLTEGDLVAFGSLEFRVELLRRKGVQ